MPQTNILLYGEGKKKHTTLSLPLCRRLCWTFARSTAPAAAPTPAPAGPLLVPSQDMKIKHHIELPALHCPARLGPLSPMRPYWALPRQLAARSRNALVHPCPLFPRTPLPGQACAVSFVPFPSLAWCPTLSRCPVLFGPPPLPEVSNGLT
ncbi:hypothetical protein LY76DRAFT_339398 [Colletotrichum caudatum]|nr:hypothetical protein LY76DRAFT_339398 [Colletotrichum caudatum]